MLALKRQRFKGLMNPSIFMQKLKENISIVIVIGLGVLLIVGGLIYSKLNKPLNITEFMQKRDIKECDIKKETVIVDGSGNDIYPPGTELEVEMNYYNCNPGQRNEVAMIISAGRPKPIFKYIKLIPGDKFKMVNHKEKYRLEINGDDMESLTGETYEFAERKSRMVKLYESNYQDGIREGVYFVFGSSLGGGFDSTRFGPVTNERMVGRVVSVKRQPSGQNEKGPITPPTNPKSDSKAELVVPVPVVTEPAAETVAKPKLKAAAKIKAAAKPEVAPAKSAKKQSAQAPKKQ